MGLPENCIPKDKLPQCWSDDTRMNALFAPFRLKSSNPESWNMKMKFWSDMLRQWCRYKNDPIITASDAKFAFQRKGRSPACLEIVVEEMFRGEELATLSKYQQILNTGPEGWVKWSARLAFKPAAIALTMVSLLLPARQALDNDGLPKASIDPTQRFVIESVAKEQAMELLNNYPAGVDRIGTIEELMRNSGWQKGKETFVVLIGCLVTLGQAVKKEDVVKLASPDCKISPVSETDEALSKLQSAEHRLECDSERLAKDIAASEADARAALKLGNRLQAKNHLRRKHKLVERAEKCENALDNVKQLLQQLRDSDVNAAIIDTYRIGAKAMKQGIKDGGLSEDAVHDTMDDLKEVMESYNEIEKALAGANDVCDAAELEQELIDLLTKPIESDSGPLAGKRDRRSGLNLPSPPKGAVPSDRKVSERSFIFDGEASLIAELNNLSVEDPNAGNARKNKTKEALTEKEQEDSDEPDAENRKSKSWYPTASESLRADDTWSNNNYEPLEMRTDDRLHPGQKLNIDFTTPPKLYSSEFQVRDQKRASGVCLYNRGDMNCNLDAGLGASTEYISTESPGKSGGSFQMAPGGERKPQSPPWKSDEENESTVDDLEKRLKNLRSFNL